jgi:hypothetical protein
LIVSLSAPFGFAQGRLLKAVPFPVKVKVKIKVKGKINVKGVGQECPTHTDAVGVKKQYGSRVRGV